MKICFEGPSGIGKTTLSKELDEEFLRIPEVNELFSDELNEGGFWYYEKQVQRYKLSNSVNNCIFDGDIFQPLWYNWTYHYPDDYFPLEKVVDFCRTEIITGNIQFPDLYIIFHTSLKDLKLRKEGDHTRRRSNFTKHLKLLESQPKYFGYMKKKFPFQVQFIEYSSILQAKEEVLIAIELRRKQPIYNSLSVLTTMAEWLSLNRI